MNHLADQLIEFLVRQQEETKRTNTQHNTIEMNKVTNRQLMDVDSLMEHNGWVLSHGPYIVLSPHHYS